MIIQEYFKQNTINLLRGFSNQLFKELICETEQALIVKYTRHYMSFANCSRTFSFYYRTRVGSSG